MRNEIRWARGAWLLGRGLELITLGIWGECEWTNFENVIELYKKITRHSAALRFLDIASPEVADQLRLELSNSYVDEVTQAAMTDAECLRDKSFFHLLKAESTSSLAQLKQRVLQQASTSWQTLDKLNAGRNLLMRLMDDLFADQHQQLWSATFCSYDIGQIDKNGVEYWHHCMVRLIQTLDVSSTTASGKAACDAANAAFLFWESRLIEELEGANCHYRDPLLEYRQEVWVDEGQLAYAAAFVAAIVRACECCV